MMGRDNKESGGTQSQKQSRQQNVSDAEIFTLLKDFTNADLFSHSADPEKSEGTLAKKDTSCHDLVTSFKYLHVHRPRLKKLRKSKKQLSFRNKRVSNLNLAVAAGNFQKPIVWPSRMNCECKGSGVALLHPSRLNVDTLYQNGHGSACGGDSFKEISMPVSSGCMCRKKFSKELPRASLGHSDTLSATFGHVAGKSNLSFTSLLGMPGDKALVYDNVGGKSCSKVSQQDHPTLQHLQHFEGKKLFTNTTIRSLPPPLTVPFEGRQNKNTTLNNNNNDTSVNFSSALPWRGVPESGSSQTDTHYRMQVPVSGATPLVSPPQATNINLRTPLGRSCSQQVRDMEDTNVNELASYLEDLLHIPRKMSSMAEMMYA